MPKTRRTVEYAGPRPRRRGGKLWGYGYSDLARMLETTEGALRARVARGTFAPGNLESVFEAWARVRGLLVAAACVVFLLLPIGCGDVTASDVPDAIGGVGGGVGGSTIDATPPGTGGHVQQAGVGGATGTGGTVENPGTGGSAATVYESCGALGWTPAGGAHCSKLISPGDYAYGTKDGHRCFVCDTPTRPASVTSDCYLGGVSDLCVRSCDECTFQ